MTCRCARNGSMTVGLPRRHRPELRAHERVVAMRLRLIKRNLRGTEKTRNFDEVRGLRCLEILKNQQSVLVQSCSEQISICHHPSSTGTFQNSSKTSGAQGRLTGHQVNSLHIRPIRF